MKLQYLMCPPSKSYTAEETKIAVDESPTPLKGIAFMVQ